MIWYDANEVLPSRSMEGSPSTSAVVLVSRYGEEADDIATYDFEVGAWYTCGSADTALVSPEPKFWAYAPKIT